MKTAGLPECLNTLDSMPLSSSMAKEAFAHTSDFHDSVLDSISIDLDFALIRIYRPYFVKWSRYSINNIYGANIALDALPYDRDALQARISEFIDRAVYSISCDFSSSKLVLNLEGIYGYEISADFGRSTLTWIVTS